ncbi:MAG TPA: hypothetical protein VGC77_21875 [Rhodopseudomonas sp.]|uniref:hypothetical protein n=1 Tax=Rhodopseudomonas sp. TaxID=1078 RepID=UPI002ED8623E
MTSLKLIGAVALLSVAVAAPALAGSHQHPRHHHRHHHHHAQDYYSHNYGPGIWPEPFAYYDGPLSALCKQSAAAYRGQDGRPHPCN